MLNEIPRRSRMEQWTAAERAIYDAVRAVEAMPADVRLTDAVILLQAARDSVADYIDGLDRRRCVSECQDLGSVSNGVAALSSRTAPEGPARRIVMVECPRHGMVPDDHRCAIFDGAPEGPKP